MLTLNSINVVVKAIWCTKVELRHGHTAEEYMDKDRPCGPLRDLDRVGATDYVIISQYPWLIPLQNSDYKLNQ